MKMKKQILILLIAVNGLSYGQITLAKKLKITNNVEQNDATRVLVQDASTKEVNWVLKESLSSNIDDSSFLHIEGDETKEGKLTVENPLGDTSSNAISILGKSNLGYGIIGTSIHKTGIRGYSDTGRGVEGESFGGPAGYFNFLGSVGNIAEFTANNTKKVEITRDGEIKTVYKVTTPQLYSARIFANYSGYGSAILGAGGTGSGESADGIVGTSIDGNGVYGNSINGVSVYGASYSGIGVKAQSDEQYGLLASSTNSAAVNATSSYGNAVEGTASDGNGIYGASNSNDGVSGWSNENSGVYGYTYSGVAGVKGLSDSGQGVFGQSANNVGVYGESVNSHGVIGQANGTYSGVYGRSETGYGLEGKSEFTYGVYARSVNGVGAYITSDANSGLIANFCKGSSSKAFIDVNGLICGNQFKLTSLNSTVANSTATGSIGEIRIDTDYIYICVATNTWKRASITTW